MENDTQTTSKEVGTLAEDARALLSATAAVAGAKVDDARNRLTAALERGKAMYGVVKDKTIECAKATDGAVRQNPYRSIGIAAVVGAFLGYVAARRGSRNGD